MVKDSAQNLDTEATLVALLLYFLLLQQQAKMTAKEFWRTKPK